MKIAKKKSKPSGKESKSNTNKKESVAEGEQRTE
jgi:hypothetical protein